MVETGDVVGGLLAGAVLADYLTIPYSAAALYLSLRGKSYWKLPYAVPIKALTKERIVHIPKITVRYPRLSGSWNRYRLSSGTFTIPGRKILLSPQENPLKFAVLTPLLVPFINRSLTLPLQLVLTFVFMIFFCFYRSKKRDQEICESEV